MAWQYACLKFNRIFFLKCQKIGIRILWTFSALLHKYSRVRRRKVVQFQLLIGASQVQWVEVISKLHFQFYLIYVFTRNVVDNFSIVSQRWIKCKHYFRKYVTHLCQQVCKQPEVVRLKILVQPLYIQSRTTIQMDRTLS